MRGIPLLVFAAMAAVAPLSVGQSGDRPSREARGRPAVALDAWHRAERGRPIALPRDHASHPGYRIEWWYYTGNLDAAGGRRFGYQLTFFRVGVDPAPRNPSRWAVRDLHMAHLAITDVDTRRHLAAERLNRAAIGWAGAATDRYEVWNDTWRVSLDGREHRLVARDEEERIALDLRATEDRAAVLHGDRGFSQKGACAGNASHYYSLTRMPTRGSVEVEGERLDVTGLSWMDHEFGTSFLERSQTGWDWFSLQLDDGTDVMVFQLRDRRGMADRQSSGTLAAAGRAPRPLGPADFSLDPGRTWRAPASGARYPVEWRVRVPGARLDLQVRAVVDDQEMGDSFASGIRYWEGAVDVAGTHGDRTTSGRGYLEMTGYSGGAMGELLGAGDCP